MFIEKDITLHIMMSNDFGLGKVRSNKILYGMLTEVLILYYLEFFIYPFKVNVRLIRHQGFARKEPVLDKSDFKMILIFLSFISCVIAQS